MTGRRINMQLQETAWPLHLVSIQTEFLSGNQETPQSVAHFGVNMLAPRRGSIIARLEETQSEVEERSRPVVNPGRVNFCQRLTTRPLANRQPYLTRNIDSHGMTVSEHLYASRYRLYVLFAIFFLMISTTTGSAIMLKSLR